MPKFTEASKSIFGIDFNSNLVKTAQMNMVMNNDGRGGLFALNSLWKPAHWPVKEARELIELGSMDFVMANPPFGTKIKVEGQDILEQYDLAHAWTKQGDKWVMEGTLRVAMPPEVLFIERCVQFLKPGTGKLGIVFQTVSLATQITNISATGFSRIARSWLALTYQLKPFSPERAHKQVCSFFVGNPIRKNLLKASHPVQTDYKFSWPLRKLLGKTVAGKIIYKRDKQGREIINRDLYPRLRDSTVLDFLPIVEPRVASPTTIFPPLHSSSGRPNVRN